VILCPLKVRQVRRLAVVSVLTLVIPSVAGLQRSTVAHAQVAGQSGGVAADGRQVYAEACATCHGLDGRGVPEVSALLDMPLPNFSDCNFAAREPDLDWGAVIHDGGPARGFDPIMPAFGEALNDAERAAALAHVRSFCSDAAWPRGELNLPRALVTEKAFPEDEAVWTMSVVADGPGAVNHQFVYERRFGARNQVEFKVPLELAEQDAGDWRFGAGDLGIGYKRAFAHSAERGYIVAAGAELVLPTGDESSGAGSGVTKVEPFVSFGQIIGSDSFIQAQGGLELPSDTEKAEREAFWRLVAGHTWTQGPNGFGRAWTPMVELLAARALEEDETTHWDLVPQVQVSLNTRQHLLMNVGVRLPVNDRTGRSTTFMVYVLWDWFDGGLLDGW